MTQFAKYLNFSSIALAAMTLTAQAATAPTHIDVNKFSTKVEDVVVPLPNEVFGALNKLGSVNWKEYVRADRGSNFTRPAANRAFAGLGDRRRLYRGSGKGRAGGEGHWPARAQSVKGNGGGQFHHAACEGNHRIGGQEPLGKRPLGTRRDAE